MALQLGALRDALISAGVPTDKASKAAEEVASHYRRQQPLINRINPGLLMLLAMIAGVALMIGSIYGGSWLLRTFPP